MFADKLCNLSDEALLSHYYQTREFKAFKLIYLRHKDRLYHYCVQMNRRHCNAILEGLWTKLLEQPPKLGGRLLRNWLFIETNRSMQRGDFLTPSTPTEHFSTTSESSTAQATDTGSSLSHDGDNDERMTATQQLPRQFRNVLLLYGECRLSLATVADIEGLPIKQCAAIYHQALEQLDILLNGKPQRAWISKKTRRQQAQEESAVSAHTADREAGPAKKGLFGPRNTTAKGIDKGVGVAAV